MKNLIGSTKPVAKPCLVQSLFTTTYTWCEPLQSRPVPNVSQTRPVNLHTVYLIESTSNVTMFQPNRKYVECHNGKHIVNSGVSL